MALITLTVAGIHSCVLAGWRGRSGRGIQITHWHGHRAITAAGPLAAGVGMVMQHWWHVMKAVARGVDVISVICGIIFIAVVFLVYRETADGFVA